MNTEDMKNIQLQQGDVTLEKIDELPKNLKKVDNIGKKIILAYGEHTGHHHRFELDNDDNGGGLALLEGDNGIRYFVNESNRPVSLIHEEHKPIVVDPGIYEIGNVYEVDHLTNMTRKVVD